MSSLQSTCILWSLRKPRCLKTSVLRQTLWHGQPMASSGGLEPCHIENGLKSLPNAGRMQVTWAFPLVSKLRFDWMLPEALADDSRSR